MKVSIKQPWLTKNCHIAPGAWVYMQLFNLVSISKAQIHFDGDQVPASKHAIKYAKLNMLECNSAWKSKWPCLFLEPSMSWHAAYAQPSLAWWPYSIQVDTTSKLAWSKLYSHDGWNKTTTVWPWWLKQNNNCSHDGWNKTTTVAMMAETKQQL